MITALVLSAALFAQGNVPAAAVQAPVERVDVGYEPLVQRRPHEAIARIEAGIGLETQDPAALINLAAAQAQLGNTAAARAALNAALGSAERYDLQLADGSWLDSRQAARIALSRLDGATTLAAR